MPITLPTVNCLDEMHFNCRISLPVILVDAIKRLQGKPNVDEFNAIKEIDFDSADTPIDSLCKHSPTQFQEVAEYQYSGDDDSLSKLMVGLASLSIPFTIEYWISDHNYHVYYVHGWNPCMKLGEVYRVSSLDPKKCMKQTKPDWKYLGSLLSHLSSHCALGIPLEEIPPFIYPQP